MRSAMTFGRICLLLEQQIGHDFLESLVLIPKLSKLMHFSYRVTVVHVAPAVEGSLRDSEIAAHLYRGRPRFDLPECLKDLIVR
jgi:hypothetical protein